MSKLKSIIILLLALLSLSGCYKSRTTRFQLPDSLNPKLIIVDTATAHLDSLQRDSLAFAKKHHYSQGFNFVVRTDSMMLLRQQPEEWISQMPTDSFAVKKGRRLVVANYKILPKDSIDSVWVQVATESYQFGWVHERYMLKHVDPDDPISQFISRFSDTHLLIFLGIITIIAVGYWLRRMLRRNARIVHFNDISSFYPTLLTLIVSASASFYASIQMFTPDTWQQFYFNPSLNPFSQPLLLAIFLSLVWLMLIVAIAALDDTRRLLPADEAILYALGLAAVCAFDYVLFSISTLYYIGYPLLIAYFCIAIRTYVRHRTTYICGNCGARLHRKGRCPKCGAINE